MENKDGMKLFLEQAVGFLSDLNKVIADIEDIRSTTTLKSETKKEVSAVYKQFDKIVDGLNKQSKKVGEKMAKLEDTMVGMINETSKRSRSMAEKLKEDLKADITAFLPMFEDVKETIAISERDAKRMVEEVEEKIKTKLEKKDLQYLEEGMNKVLIDDENISSETAYSSQKTIEKIDNMINNLRLGGRGKIFVLENGNDLGQATAINFKGAGVTTTVENGIHTVDIPGGGGGGAVDSVNGQTGVVVIDSTDIADFQTAVSSNSDVTANTAKVTNATHTGDVTGATALTIADDVVTNAKLANMATKTYKGRTSGGTGDPEDVPVATLKTDLALVKGDVGLGNVDNTSDLNKPISTATQSALDAKGNVSNSGTPVATQLAIFNSANTVQGISGLNRTGTTLEVPGNLTATGVFILNTAIRLLSSGGINYYQNGDGTGGSWRECRFAKYSSGDWYMRLDATGKLQMGNGSGAALGTAINEFSTDGTLAGNSDDAVPTERAVKTALDLKANDADVVKLTGNQTVAGIKTFSDDVSVPDDAYDATTWNGNLEVPTKNAIRDKIETMGVTPGGADTQIQFNNAGVFGGVTGSVYNGTSFGFDFQHASETRYIYFDVGDTVDTTGIYLQNDGTWLAYSGVNDYYFKNTTTNNSIIIDTSLISTTHKRVTFPNSSGDIVLNSNDQTLTNKRITPRVTSEASSATPTINTDNTDIHRITALAVNITSMTTNLSGTPTHGQKLIVEITGTAARTITWGASFEASTVALPTTTVTTEMLTVGFMRNSATSKWRCVAVA